MNSTLDLIKNELEQIATAVKALPSNDPFNIAHGNWSFPGITRDELAQAALDLANIITLRGGDELKANEKLLADYPRRLTFLRANTITQLWGNSAAVVPCYLATLDGLKKALEPALGSVDAEAIESAKSLKRLAKQLRAIEATISNLDPRSKNLAEMVTRIEQAHETADQLPTDLETLQEARRQIQDLLREANEDRGAVDKLLEDVRLRDKELEESERKASAILDRCDDAYRTKTSETLAKAFNDRAKSLNISMWVWVGGLVLALWVGAVLGSNQLQNLAEAIKAASGKHDGTVWLHLLLSLLSIGAPVWFAWVATKQIGHRFRLAEDYGYKASISKAYEGYRREATLLDPEFQRRLFSSALTRLDEIPLRLVESDTHGSPWHELASSDVVRQAVGTVPGFVDRVSELAKDAVSVLSKDKKASPAATVAAADVAAAQEKTQA